MLHQADKEETCPYNPSHRVSRQRMPFHLVKCKKNYPTQDVLICPMNATHHIPKRDYQSHLETCPNRYVVDSALCDLTPKEDSSAVAPPLSKATVQSILPKTEESWDDECASTYDPTAHCANRMIIRTLKNASRAEKKRFQLAERQRLIDLQSNGPLQRNPELNVTAKDECVQMPKTQSLIQSFIVPQESMDSNQ